VAAVGSAQGTPFSGWNVQAGISVEGQSPRAPGQELIAHYQVVSADYFKAIGVPVLKGRGIAPQDRDTANLEVVVNELFAKRAFPNQDPIGKRVKIGELSGSDPWATIIGVIRDFRHYRLPQPMGPAMYYAYNEWPQWTQTIVVRTTPAGEALGLAPRVMGVLKQLDPDLPAYQVQTLEQQVDRSLWRQRLQGQVIGLFAALAMILATIGIYGVISYSVAQRTREVGVRVALGATRAQVMGLVLRQGVFLVGTGLVLGLLAALAATRLLTKLLYGIAATDLVTFAGVPLVLGVVAVLASWLPARRASRIDPLIAMRSD
jgi:putative ABC transport system permease protein